ncbi:MipA/OmpV family protein [uncultured Deefgea sp.]|uniref:MipA/OmpV family protein n=1 Tax=uncultured Deefgea sp. TaxID=1304914 RepID=UPI00262682B9|nr:MipA/OmpV family protein [uncultured Deefgea sp.]
MPSALFNRCIARLALSIMALSAIPAQAEIDLGSLDFLASDNPQSPIPSGLIVGAVVFGGQARYQAQDATGYAIPGLIYFGDRLMYLGDRARYYFYKENKLGLYAYGRVRFGNLDPEDNAAFAGMLKRKGQFEAGVGLNYALPYALLSMRVSSDITGNSRGQEALFWTDFPIVRDNLLIMPGMGVMVRSSKMANYYFGGVSAQEASSSRPSWDTGSTVSPMLAIISSYRINKSWIGMAAVNYELYDKNIQNSPIVQHRGELYAGLGLGYIW